MSKIMMILKYMQYTFFLVMFFSYFVSFATLEPREDLEYYQLSLFDLLYQSIDRKELKKYKLSNFTDRKSNTLNFFEASGLLLFAWTNKKNDKYVLWALERLYTLSADAKLSELLLWNLANEYEKCEKYRIANELYYQFKKIFPGASFYWTARIKEVTSMYKFCQEEYYDIFDTERAMRLACDYIVDAQELNQDLDNEVIYILHDLSLRIIKKIADIGAHYLKKNQYTYNPICILSAWQRLDQLISEVNYFLNIAINGFDKDKKQMAYQATLIEINKIIQSFFNKHEEVVLPNGFDYEEQHEAILSYILNKKEFLLDNLKDIYNKINYAVEVYYEM